MEKDESGVEHLKDTLYSRKSKHNIEDVRIPLSKSDIHPPVAWERPVEESAPKQTLYVPQYKNHMAFATKFLIASSVFFVCAVVGALAYFFVGGNYISTDNIDIEIISPPLVDGGTPANLQFIITNRNTTELQLAELVIRYPEGTRDPENPEKALSYQRLPVGSLASGRQIKLTSSALFYGSEGQTQNVEAALEYSVQGSNAVFIKESAAVVTIGSSPITVRIEAPSEAIVGEPFTTVVTIQGNGEEVVEDVVLRAQYPFGYSVQSATPKADAGTILWRLGAIKPGETKTITIVGAIDGQDGDERVFHFLAGTNDDQTAGTVKVPFLSVPMSLTVHRPFITASLSVDGKSGQKISAGAGKTLQGVVEWKNNLSDTVTDVEVVLKLNGPALDRDSVVAGNGFYQSSNNTITWTSAEDSFLASVPPGGGGTLNFSFGSLVPGANGVVYTNPVIGLDVTVVAARGGQGNVPTRISSAASMEVLFSSAVALTAQTLFSSGPLTNSGPVPPRAEAATTYTIQWTIKNASNAIANGAVSATLPAYVTFVEAASGSAITYDASSRTVRWNTGELKAGLGYNSAAKTGSFKVQFIPSVSQVGTAPLLTGRASFNGTDRFTSGAVSASSDAATTALGDASYVSGMDIVGPAQ